MRIVLVEDEPAAMRYARSLIEMMGGGYEITDTAENGSDALEKIRDIKPDVVITDIKMGVMDGIELVSRVKDEFPFIYSIIVSGYQDFEYAKGAMKHGVVDYLLKPLNAGQLQSVLEGIRLKLSEEYYERRVEILGNVLGGMREESWKIEKYLPFSAFNAAVVRKNGLPSRFSKKISSVYNSIFLEMGLPQCLDKMEGLWAVAGRDDQEVVFFHADGMGSGMPFGMSSGRDSFEKAVLGMVERLCGGFHTTVFSPGRFGFAEAADVIQKLNQIIDNSIILGQSRIITASDSRHRDFDSSGTLDGAYINKIDFLLSNAMYDEMKRELIKLFEWCEAESKTQLWVEGSLRQMMRHVETNAAAGRSREKYNLEYMLDDAMHYSSSYEELLTSIWGLIEGMMERKMRGIHKMGTSDYFASIQQYVERNLSEPLSLQSTCSVFGISQTYMSRLFRKYKKMSFVEYLTKQRIDRAKKLIDESPDIPIKDVALFVGYSDPFYFSRVFRSLTGIPPSEYIANRVSSAYVGQ